jgi:hypothetical protein
MQVKKISSRAHHSFTRCTVLVPFEGRQQRRGSLLEEAGAMPAVASDLICCTLEADIRPAIAHIRSRKELLHPSPSRASISQSTHDICPVLEWTIRGLSTDEL